MEEKFFLTLYEHRVLGYIFLAYWGSKQKNQDYYALKERITEEKLEHYDHQLSDVYGSIVKLIEEYSDTSILKVFSKKKTSTKQFLSSVDEEYLAKNIRPYIEKRLIKIVNLLVKSGIKLYYKTELNNIYTDDEILVPDEFADAVFHFKRTPEELQYHLTILFKDKELEITDKPGIAIVNDPSAIVIDNQLFVFNDIDSKKLTPFFVKKHVKIPKASEEKYFQTFVKTAIEKYKVKAEGFNIEELYPSPEVKIALESDLKGEPSFRLKFKYLEVSREFETIKEQTIVLLSAQPDYAFKKIHRNHEKENEILKAICNIGLQKSDHDYLYVQHINGEVDNDLAKMYAFYVAWLNAHAKRIEDLGVQIASPNTSRNYYLNKYELKIDINDYSDWFDIKAYIFFDGFKLPFIALRKNILEGIREYELPNGQVFIIPEEWFSKYKEFFTLGQTKDENITLKKQHFTLVKEIKGIDKKKLQKIYDITLLDKPAEIPAEIKATLRTYQHEGYSWMRQLSSQGFGVCLADDMGLGKTLQTLTLLQSVLNNYKENKDEEASTVRHDGQLSLFDVDGNANANGTAENMPALIIMPTSLIHNWENEIQKFVPNINVIRYFGSDRKNFEHVYRNAHVILTTYGILRNDFEILKNYAYLFIVLDESQIIKNPESKTYKAAIKLQSKNRAVLTGTPIENSLTDLWSQMNFLNKGLLGSFNFFKTEFVTPIEHKNDEEQKEKLKRLIQPFILRRTKEEVAPELPELTEQVVYCDLSEKQKIYYEEEKSKVRNNILENIQKTGREKSSFIILQGLTLLRQIANHPLLVNPDYGFDSGKFEEINSHLENIIQEKHKVLIFSSFVKHLELLEQEFTSKKYQYCKLTGETQHREKVISEFQNNDNINFFLISLKAGGVGLNLTAADYVFILDPWWNPAAEAQAINRAHRIGQTNKVFVYRFIAHDTIEEKIQKLQQKKLMLMDDFVNNTNAFKDMDTDTLMRLFD